MPYRTRFEMPEVFMVIDDHPVYYTYKNDNLDNHLNTFRFTFDPFTDQEDREDINVQELPGFPENYVYQGIEEQDAMFKNILTDAFNQGLIKPTCQENQNTAGLEGAATNAQAEGTPGSQPSGR